MINSTQDLLDKVLELKAAIADLPDIKNIEINITGDAVEVIQAIKDDLNSLDNRTVEVNIVYKNIGGPEDIKNATQVIQQVVLPASDTIKEQTQVIEDVGESVGNVSENLGDNGINPAATEQGTAAMKQYASEVDDAAESTAHLTTETEGTASSIENLEAMTDRAVSNVSGFRAASDEASDSQNLLAASVDKVNADVDDGNIKLTTAARNLAKLVSSTNDASSAQDNFANAVENIKNRLDEANLSSTQQSAVMSRLGYVEDQAGISAARLAAAQASASNETETYISVSDALRETLAAITDSSISSANGELILAAATKMLGDNTNSSSVFIKLFAAQIAAAGGDAATFLASVDKGDSVMIAFSDAIHDAGGSVGAALIPITAATFGITGMATAIHLIVMGTFEFLAVFVPAMIAGGAAALVMMQGVGIVADGLKSMYTATEALGPTLGATSGDMLGLGHSLQTAQNDANPGIYELLGETIIGLQKATGPTTDGLSAFGQMGLSVEHIMENFAANIDVGLGQSMGTIRTLVSGGVADLVMFGQILGNIGHAILNLAADMPGLAEIILRVVDGFSQLIKWITNLPPMLITVIMGIEETYRWSGLLAGGLAVLGRALALIGTLGIPVFAKIGMNFASMAASLISGVAGLVANLATGFARIAEAASDMAKAMDASALAGGIDAAADAVESGAIGIIGGLSKVVEFLGGPWGAAIALAVVGLGILTFWLSRSTPSATQIFISNINKAVAAASNLTVLNVIGESMEQVTNKIAQQGVILSQSMHQAAVSAQSTVGPYQASTTAIKGASDAVSQSVGPYNSSTTTANSMTDAQKKAAEATSQSIGPYNSQSSAVAAAAEQQRGAVGVYGTIPTAAANAGIAIQQLTVEQTKLFNNATSVISGAQGISKAYGTNFASSLGIADIAGVNLSNTQVILGNNANAAGIKIEGLVEGYEKMGQSGSILSNAMAAVNVQAGEQASKVSALNQAWDAFMSMAQSLTGGITTVNSDIQQMGTALDTTNSAGKTIPPTISQVAQSLTSFSGTSTQTWSSYNQALSSAETFTDSLRTGMAAGAISGGQYTQAIASVAQSLLPYAANSSAARSQLDVLLQEAGQPFTNNFSTMKSWIDKNAVSTGNFTSMINTLTGKLSNVTQVAQNFAGTLQSDVIGAIAQAAVSTTNITGLASAYTKSLEANGAAATSTKQDQDAFNATLIKLGFNQTEVNQLDAELTTGYGKQAAAAKNLKGATDDTAKSLAPGLSGAAETAGSAVGNAANTKLPSLKSAADTLKSHIGDLVTSLTPGVVNGAADAGKALDGLRSPHLSAAQQAMDTVKQHTQEMTQSFAPGVSTGTGPAASALDTLRNPHLSAAQAAMDQVKLHTQEMTTTFAPGVSVGTDGAGNALDTLRTPHLSAAQTAMDQVKLHTQEMTTTFAPGVSTGTGPAGDALDTLRNPHLSDLQNATDTVKQHTILMTSSFAPGVSAATTPAGQAADDLKSNHLSPLKDQTDLNKASADKFSSSLSPGLTGGLDQAGNHADTTRNAHLTPLQTIIKDLNTIVADLNTLLKNFPTNEHTNVNVTGTGGASIKSTVPGVSGGALDVLGLAGGGVLPGYNPGFDSIPAMLSPGEGVLVPEAVRSMGGAKTINNINEQSRQHFATGGVADVAVFKAAGTMAKTIAGTGATDITDAVQQTMIRIIAKMQSEASAYQAAQAAKQASGKLLKGSTSGSVASWLTTALNATGHPLSWLGDLEWLVNAESSGNPSAVDPIVVDGQNATGLLQTLPSTYAEYGGAPGGILNPVDNAEAAIRYIAARYGSPGNIPGIGVHDSGYDAGGWLMPGLTLAHNNTGQPERVVGPNEGGQTIHATFHVDGKQLFEAMAPIAYQKAARNNGNSNASAYWAPGNKR